MEKRTKRYELTIEKDGLAVLVIQREVLVEFKGVQTHKQKYHFTNCRLALAFIQDREDDNLPQTKLWSAGDEK